MGREPCGAVRGQEGEAGELRDEVGEAVGALAARSEGEQQHGVVAEGEGREGGRAGGQREGGHAVAEQPQQRGELGNEQSVRGRGLCGEIMVRR